ncbi:Fic family protein [Erwinia sp.]|uniref:Fic family protein n=1 Tax=Erwinia citreus TaxID=558 RepID=UPI003C738120
MTSHWIWQHQNWPNFHWSESTLLPRLREIQQLRGILLGSSDLLPDDEVQTLDTLLANILSSSAIEDERVNAQSVRSSLARRLGVTEDQPWPVSDRSEGLAAMMMDAVDNRQHPLTVERLCQWHQWLFPEDTLSVHSLAIGKLRGNEPMQVVSGRIDKPVVHFVAPPREGLEVQLAQFVSWFTNSQQDALLDPLLRAAISHLWFITLHPFDDGNGRITRALTDLALSQADSQTIRLYAMSPAILTRRASYYSILEQTQKGDLDITAWMSWFLDTLQDSIKEAITGVERTQSKARFWLRHQHDSLSKEQIKVLNRLLDGGDQGFESGISASQYQKVAKVSKATATRHLSNLLNTGLIEKMPGAGRSTRYKIVDNK